MVPLDGGSGFPNRLWPVSVRPFYFFCGVEVGPDYEATGGGDGNKSRPDGVMSN